MSTKKTVCDRCGNEVVILNPCRTEFPTTKRENDQVEFFVVLRYQGKDDPSRQHSRSMDLCFKCASDVYAYLKALDLHPRLAP